jgi:hypothetical protein
MIDIVEMATWDDGISESTFCILNTVDDFAIKFIM